MNSLNKIDTEKNVLLWDSSKIVEYLNNEIGHIFRIDVSQWAIINGRILDLIDSDDLKDLGIQSEEHRILILQKIDNLLNKKDTNNDSILINQEPDGKTQSPKI